MYFSTLRSWCVTRVANLGFVAVLCLMVAAFWVDRPSHHDGDQGKGHRHVTGERYNHRHHRDQISNSQLVFVYYTLFVHVLGLLFPIRLCWATLSMIKNFRKIPTQSSQLPSTARVKRTYQSKVRRHSATYESSVSSLEYSGSESELELASSTSSEWEDDLLIHAIIIPNYKEELDTLRETLDIFASHILARSSYEIYLAMEQGEVGCDTKAATLTNDYAKLFRSIEHTIHPYGLPGEAQGKSSNLCWAAQHVNKKYPKKVLKKNVIVTVIDSDSHLSSRYFSLINSMHFELRDTANTTMYVPPIIFDRNAHQVPRLVRVGDLLWAGAGLSGHYVSSSICPPTSVYSLPLSLVDRVGGWDAGEEAIGEDLHMFIKCFFFLSGNLTVKSVFSPASHSNVHSDGKGIRGFFQDLMARYKQALRHMWGALDSGFVLRSASNMLWQPRTDASSVNWGRTFVLMHRMFEAHFLPIHITLLILGGGLYTLFTPQDRIPRLLIQTMDITGYLRIVSALEFIYFFYLYDTFHHLCVKGREEEMLRAGLADRMMNAFSYRSLRKTGLDFVLFPVAGVVFGTIPAVVALTCQFWTLSLVYKVSKKPSRQVAP